MTLKSWGTGLMVAAPIIAALPLLAAACLFIYANLTRDTGAGGLGDLIVLVVLATAVTAPVGLAVFVTGLILRLMAKRVTF